MPHSRLSVSRTKSLAMSALRAQRAVPLVVQGIMRTVSYVSNNGVLLEPAETTATKAKMNNARRTIKCKATERTETFEKSF